MQGVTFELPLGKFLSHMEPADFARLELAITLSLPVDCHFSECLDRRHLPGYLHLIGATVGAEIGVQTGEFSEHLLSEWPGKLFLVDPWAHQESDYTDVANVTDLEHETNYQKCKTRLAGFGCRAEYVREFSPLASWLFADNSLDFVYLDGNHSYEAVKDDLAAWLPKVRPGGLITGHDFIDLERDNLIIQVKSAVVDFVREYYAGQRVPVFCSREPWPSLWMFRKI